MRPREREGMKNCQLPCLPQLAAGEAPIGPQPLIFLLKQIFAKAWNHRVKRWLKPLSRMRARSSPDCRAKALAPLQAGDIVRVRTREEIERTLDQWHELKGCAFLEYMWQYCSTEQRVLQPLERFLDERDYKVKKGKGLVLLENVICRGTPVFGRCDRCCFLFWREEWLEKLPSVFEVTISACSAQSRQESRTLAE